MNMTDTNKAKNPLCDAGVTEGPRNDTSLTPLNIAYHEAGHAIAAFCHGIPVEKVTIKPAKNYLGCCWYYYNSASHLEPLARMRLAVAGAIAGHIGSNPNWNIPARWRPSSIEGAGGDMKVVREELEKLCAAKRLEDSAKRNKRFDSETPLWESMLIYEELEADYRYRVLEQVIQETYEMLRRPDCRRALDMLASALLKRGTLSESPNVNHIIRDTMAFPSAENFVFAPGLDFDNWDRAVEMGGSYDDKKDAWWIPASEIPTLFRLQDEIQAQRSEDEDTEDLMEE